VPIHTRKYTRVPFRPVLALLLSTSLFIGAAETVSAAGSVEAPVTPVGPLSCLDLPVSSALIAADSCWATGPTSMVVAGSDPDGTGTGAVIIIREQATQRLTFKNMGSIRVFDVRNGHACLASASAGGDLDLASGVVTGGATSTCNARQSPLVMAARLSAQAPASAGTPQAGSSPPALTESYYVYGAYTSQCGTAATTGCPLYVDGARQSVPPSGGLTVLDFGAPCYVPNTTYLYGTQLFNTRGCTPDDQLVPLAAAWVRGYESAHGAGSPVMVLAAGTSNSLTAADPPTYALTPAQMQGHGQAWFAAVVTPLVTSTAGLPAPIRLWAASDMEQANDGNWYGPNETKAWVTGYGTATGVASKNCDGSTPLRLADYGDDVVGNGGWTSADIYQVAWGATVACALPEIYYSSMATEWQSLNTWAQQNGKSPIQFTGVMSEDGQAGSLSAASSWNALALVTGQSPPFLTVIASFLPAAPSNVIAKAYDGFARVSWTPPWDGGNPITRYTVTPYIASTPQPATVLSASPAPTETTFYGLANGTTYTFTVTASNGNGTGPSASSNAVTPAGPPARLILPALSNGAYGGFVSAISIADSGATAASITVDFFDQAGNVIGNGETLQLSPHQGATLRQDDGASLPAGSAGSAIVFSDQPVAAFVNEFPSGNAGDATSYTAVPASGAAATLYAPAMANNAYGGYTTGIGLLNLGASPTVVTITYRDTGGSSVKIAGVAGLAAHGYIGLYSGDPGLGLPSGFAGTATITSDGQPLAAVVNEVGPGGQFSSYDAVPAGQQTLQAPAALSNAFGGFNTGIGIQNTSATAGTVAITYYDSAGTLAKTSTFQIAANGYLGVYQGTDVPTGAYTARISTPTGGVMVAAIVNEVGPAHTGAQQSTSYNTVAVGAATANLPLVESAGSDGWSTGLSITNTGTTVATVTVSYFDLATGASLGTSQSQPLQPNAYWGVYQPTGGLPAGDRASAVVSTNGGTVTVICNESSPTTFMSYDGQ
jgi:hypothetical protein